MNAPTPEEQRAAEQLAHTTAPEELKPIMPRIDTGGGVAAWDDSVPERVYHSDRAHVSQTALKLVVEKTPAHFYDEWSRPYNDSEATPAQRAGKLVHLALLEPKLYAQRVVVSQKFDRRTNEGKAGYKAFHESLPPDAEVVDADEKRAIEDMVVSVLAHRGARALIEACTKRELTGFFTCPRTGIRRRVRLDGYGPGVIIDLKGTTDASEEAFKKSIWEWRYDLQWRQYNDAALAIDKVGIDYAWIVFERDPPYAVAVYTPTSEIIDTGTDDMHFALDTLKACITSNKWPAYGDEVREIGLPKWAKSRRARHG